MYKTWKKAHFKMPRLLQMEDFLRNYFISTKFVSFTGPLVQDLNEIQPDQLYVSSLSSSVPVPLSTYRRVFSSFFSLFSSIFPFFFPAVDLFRYPFLIALLLVRQQPIFYTFFFLFHLHELFSQVTLSPSLIFFPKIINVFRGNVCSFS